MSRAFYHCDLCKSQYSTLAEAVECEVRHCDLVEQKGYKLIGLDHDEVAEQRGYRLLGVESVKDFDTTGLPEGVARRVYVRIKNSSYFIEYGFNGIGRDTPVEDKKAGE